MSIPYSNIGRGVNIHKIRGLNFEEFHNNEIGKKTIKDTMGRTNIRANETSNNNILSLSVGDESCGNINAELNGSSEKRLHINCNNVLTDGLTITQDGNVGIGKTDPTAKLHINGSVTAGATTLDSLTTTGDIEIKHDFGSTATSWGAPVGIQTTAKIEPKLGGTNGNGGEILFYTKADNGPLNERLKIYDTGTSSPYADFNNKAVLEMDGSIIMGNNDRRTSIFNRALGTANDEDLIISANSNTRDMGISFDTNGDTKMRIKKNGDVGIGISPTAKLDVNGSIKGGATTVSSLTTNAINSEGNQTIQVNGNIQCNSSFTTGKIGARTGTGIFVDAGLDVNGSIKAGATTVSQLEISTSSYGKTSFNDAGNGYNYISGATTRCESNFRMQEDKVIEFGDLQWWFLQSGVIWFNLLYAYTHNGSQQVQNELNFGFNKPISNGSWAKLFTITGDKIHYRRPLQNSSDDRLKHNETNIVKGLNIIRQLQPEKYQKTVEMYEADYKGVIDETSVWEAGLIAQKVLQIPELTDYVAGGDKIGESGEKIENAYSLDYNSISMYSLAAIKELDAIVQAQQSKIDSLEARLAFLEK